MNKKAKTKPLYHEKAAEKMLELMAKQQAPWQKPWKAGAAPGLPMNPTTGKSYNGMNAMMLSIAQPDNDPRWMTYRQATNTGAQVREGEKSTVITYWSPVKTVTVKDDNGKPVKDKKTGKPLKKTVKLARPTLSYARVFHASQIDGLEPHVEEKEQPAWQRHAQAEKVLASCQSVIKHDQGDRAYFQPATDEIHLPSRHLFDDQDGYYGTALHEMAHATGHPSRLDRDMSHPFGSEGYAKEELVAEMASWMMAMELGIEHDPSHTAAYTKSWIKTVQNDPAELFRAAAQADKAKNYMLDRQQEHEAELGSNNIIHVKPMELAYHDEEKGSYTTGWAVFEGDTRISQFIHPHEHEAETERSKILAQDSEQEPEEIAPLPQKTAEAALPKEEKQPEKTYTLPPGKIQNAALNRLLKANGIKPKAVNRTHYTEEGAVTTVRLDDLPSDSPDFRKVNEILSDVAEELDVNAVAIRYNGNILSVHTGKNGILESSSLQAGILEPEYFETTQAEQPNELEQWVIEHTTNETYEPTEPKTTALITPALLEDYAVGAIRDAVQDFSETMDQQTAIDKFAGNQTTDSQIYKTINAHEESNDPAFRKALAGVDPDQIRKTLTGTEFPHFLKDCPADRFQAEINQMGWSADDTSIVRACAVRVGTPEQYETLSAMKKAQKERGSSTREEIEQRSAFAKDLEPKLEAQGINLKEALTAVPPEIEEKYYKAKGSVFLKLGINTFEIKDSLSTKDLIADENGERADLVRVFKDNSKPPLTIEGVADGKLVSDVRQPNIENVANQWGKYNDEELNFLVVYPDGFEIAETIENDHHKSASFIFTLPELEQVKDITNTENKEKDPSATASFLEASKNAEPTIIGEQPAAYTFIESNQSAIPRLDQKYFDKLMDELEQGNDEPARILMAAYRNGTEDQIKHAHELKTYSNNHREGIDAGDDYFKERQQLGFELGINKIPGYPVAITLNAAEDTLNFKVGKNSVDQLELSDNEQADHKALASMITRFEKDGYNFDDQTGMKVVESAKTPLPTTPSRTIDVPVKTDGLNTYVINHKEESAEGKRFAVLLPNGKKEPFDKGKEAEKFASKNKGLLYYTNDGEVIYNFSKESINLTKANTTKTAPVATRLNIPFADKDEAKQAAGKLPDGSNAIDWDKKQKTWYAKPGCDLNQVEQWLPENTPDFVPPKSASEIEAEKLEAKQRAEEARATQQTEKAELYETTATNLQKEWDGLPKPTQAANAGMKQDANGNKVVPMRDENGKLWTVQRVNDKGIPLLEKGGKLSGNFHITGDKPLSSLKGQPAIVITTDADSAYALAAMRNKPTVMTASNQLNSVIEKIKKAHPDAEIVIAGQDQRHLAELGKPNYARDRAEKAADRQNATALFPRFQSQDKGGDSTTWGHMTKKYGMNAVKNHWKQQTHNLKNQNAERAHSKPEMAR